MHLKFSPARPSGFPAGGSDADEHLSSLAVITELIRRGRAATRAELAKQTGYGLKLLAQRLDELESIDLIERSELAPSTGGRAPRRLKFNRTAGEILVVEFNVTKIAAGICDLAGDLLVSREEPADVASSADRSVEQAEALLDELLRDRGPNRPPLWGIGVGILGPVDVESGRPIALPTMATWQDYPIGERLSKRFGLPVWMDNNVNLMALSQVRRPDAHVTPELVYIELGAGGMGAGLISGGRIIRGKNGCAGELGHVVVTDDESVTCWCGNTGCLTQLAGGRAVVRAAAAMAKPHAGGSGVSASGLAVSSLTVSDVAAAARDGDPASIEIVSGAGRMIGKASAALITLLNPAVVVFGGELSRAGDALLAPLRESIYRYGLPMATRALRIELAESSDNACLVGAGELAIDALLSPSGLGALLESPNV